MPTFDTPEPIQVLVDVSGADLTVHAVEQATTTTVDIAPHNPGRSVDVQHAGRTVVEFADGRLTIRAPRSKARLRSYFGVSSERISLTITLPAGSQLEARGWGDVRASGELGSVEIDTGMGDIVLDRVAGVRARTALGEIRVGSASGPAELRTSTGTVTVGTVQGELVAKTPVGDVNVDEGHGELRLSTSAGNVRVRRALAGVSARTSAGDVRLGSVCSGYVDAKTSYGKLEIGIAHGTAAWLDVSSRFGAISSDLEDIEGPGQSELTVRIRAVTSYGDIVLRRA